MDNYCDIIFYDVDEWTDEGPVFESRVLIGSAVLEYISENGPITGAFATEVIDEQGQATYSGVVSFELNPRVEEAKFNVTLNSLNAQNELTYVIGQAFKPEMTIDANARGRVYLVVDGEIMASSWNFDDGVKYIPNSYPSENNYSSYPSGTPYMMLDTGNGGMWLETNTVYLDETFNGKTANFRVYVNNQSVDMPSFTLIGETATQAQCEASVETELTRIPAFETPDLDAGFNVNSSFKVSSVEMKADQSDYQTLNGSNDYFECSNSCDVPVTVDSVVTLRTTLEGCSVPVETQIDVSSLAHDQFDVQTEGAYMSSSTSYFPVGVAAENRYLRLSVKHNQDSRLRIKIWRQSEYPNGTPVSDQVVTYSKPNPRYNETAYSTITAYFDLVFKEQTERLVYEVTDGFGQMELGEVTATHNLYYQVNSSGGYQLDSSRTMTPDWDLVLEEHNFDTRFDLNLYFSPADYYMYQCAVTIDGKSIWEYFPGYSGNKTCHYRYGYTATYMNMNIPFVPSEWIGKTAQIYVRARTRSGYTYKYFIYETPMLVTEQQDTGWSLNPCSWSDTDSDGMPDGWEYKVGLNPVVDDANVDRNDDGESNINEYIRTYQPIGLCTADI